jgi:ribonuclease G
MCETTDKRIAVVFDNGQLSHLALETLETLNADRTGQFLRSSISEMVPSLEAIFLDGGLKRPVFLKYADYESVKSLETLQHGDPLLVQVMKEPQPGKGARVTTHYQLAGSYLVFLPTAGYCTLSKEISDEQERRRLLEWIRTQENDGEGWIIRSRAVDVPYRQLEEEMENLRNRWQKICADYENWVASTDSGNVIKRPQTGMIADGSSFAERMFIRFSKLDIQDVVLDANVAMGTDLASRSIRVVDEKEKSKLLKNLEQQIKPYAQGKIRLSGGGLVICEKTEALTVIDIDCSRSKSEVDLAKTALHVNLQAADAIGKWLRISETGGMVVIDFINMESNEDCQSVVAALRSACGEDNSEIQLVGWTGLGLFELTRKRTNNQRIQGFHV